MDQSNPQNQQPAGQVVDVSYDEQPSQSMLNPPKKKKGKLVLVILLIFTLLIGSAAAGWWYGSSQTRMASDQKINELQKSISDLEKELDQKKADTKKETQDFLVIKEWGLKLSNLTPGFKYVITSSKNAANNTTQTIWFTNDKAQNLFKKYGACGTYEDNLNHFYLAALTRENSEVEQVAGLTFLKQIDDKFYYYTLSNGLCSEGEDVQIESKAREELRDALFTIKKL